MSNEGSVTTTSRTVRLFSDQLMVEMAARLVEKGLVTRTHIDELQNRRMLTGENLDALLIKEGLVSETDILSLLSELSGIPFRHAAELKIQEEAIRKVPARVALRYHLIPVEIRGGIITLAVNRIPTLAMSDSLRMVLNTAINWTLCTESDITKSIKHFYGVGAEAVDSLVEAAKDQDIDEQGTDISAVTADEGVVKFVNQIILEAIRMDATDIHIEPFENSLRLRYRIDGILQTIPLPEGIAHLRKAITSCVKIMANLNIAERRKPHDGRIAVRSGNEEFDLRVSILPTPFGETVCLRILNRKTMFIDLEHLGLTKDQAPLIKYLGDLPHGVVLLTGPTGSGKTTTLYALLAKINTPDVKIITVEDPIEYQMDGINQIQVHSQIGLTFASILRSILRHDPDIILIGEIRDTETADIAVRASLTGHLVFSTLHTNDAPSAVTRLTDMDVEPYLISSCLEGVIAQRLVRRICLSCKEESTPAESVIEEISSDFPHLIKDARFYTGRGCPDCNFTGYKGRIALFEIMIMNDAIRSLIVRQRPANEIKHQAIRDGLVTLRKDGWRRVLDGITTVEEVMRVAHRTELSTSKSQ